MDISIEIPSLGATATRAEIIDNHTDVAKMLMTIYVGLFNDAGDRLKVFTVDRQLTGFPIPSLDEQWQIITPVLADMQQAAE